MFPNLFKVLARFCALSVFVASSVIVAPLSASRVSPMIVEMTPTGRSSVGRVELTNDADRDIAYEVQMMRGEISKLGVLSLEPADEQFLVFPPQTVLEANSQQVFRVQYVGEEALDQSQIYYLSIRQIPVAFEEGQNQVQVVVNYNVLVNVVPNGTSPAPVIRAADYVEREQSIEGLAEEDIPEVIPVEKGLLVDLGNDGTRYFFASQANWTISATTLAGAPWELSLSGREISEFTGIGVVGPGKTRQFFIPTEEPLRPGSISVTLDF